MTSSPSPVDDEPGAHSTAQLTHFLYPVTALEHVSADTAVLLLAGEGSFLRICSAQSCRVLHTQNLFLSDPIHGIKARGIPKGRNGRSASIQALVWAGRSIVTLRIDSRIDSGGHGDLSLELLNETHADSWILDACFYPPADNGHDAIAGRAVVLTSYNVLYLLHIDEKGDNTHGHTRLCCVSSGPRSLLYSAHIVWLPEARGLVAAGTVFGEVLVWSFSAKELHSTFSRVVSSHLHSTFNGHEGSVFGVQISEYDPSTLARRFLASCSDDRTIRIWDVTDISKVVAANGMPGESNSFVEHEDKRNGEGATSPCVAMAMGHISRIWGLRFLPMRQGVCQILSYGEDATAQIWRLNTPVGPTSKSATASPLSLQHSSTYGFHFGKNVWAAAVSHTTGIGCHLSTGGADCRITRYQLGDLDQSFLGCSWQRQYRMEEVCSQLLSRETTKRLFKALKGSWKLKRYLHSAIATYPSGMLEGTATFQERPSTDPAYDMEYLYTENGQLVTEQGFCLPASRRYVYRYRESTEQMSAWFVKPEDGETVDYLFHVLDFEISASKLFEPRAGDTAEHATAHAHHLCIDDNYQVGYVFSTQAMDLSSWSVKYTVKGPSKDYVADSRYYKNDAAGIYDVADTSAVILSTAKSSDVLTGPTSGHESTPSNTDSFKEYAWINRQSFLASTGDGWLLIGVLSDTEPSGESALVTWDQIGQYEDLKGTCLTAKVEHTDSVLLTGTGGVIYLYRHDSRRLTPFTKLPRKIAYLHASFCQHGFGSQLESGKAEDIFVFASCLGTSTAYYLLLDNESKDARCRQFQVDVPAAFVTTSSHFAHRLKFLILGARSGDIVFYSIGSEADTPHEVVQNLHIRQVHGQESVTSIQTLPSPGPGTSTDSFYVLTTGRDGKYRTHKISHCNSGLSFETVHTGIPPFGPNIEGAYFSPTSQELFLYGFRSREFVVWNETEQRETMTVECGGAHRHWAYTHLKSRNGGGRFIWTKASAFNIHSQAQASHRIVQHGGHGREIKAVAVSPATKSNDDARSKFLATGAEDTSIRILGFTNDREGAGCGLRCLHTLSRHVTGSQQLRWSKDGRYLFSAAGREEFFVWRVQPVPLLQIGVVSVSHCPAVSESGDLRIMDFDVLEVHSADSAATERFILPMAYSDSSVRVGPWFPPLFAVQN